MYQRILVPTDLTDRTVKALEVATGIGQNNHAHVTLLHVIETINPVEFDEFASFYRKLEERARKLLDEIVTRTHALQGRVDMAIVYGNRAEEVLRFARSHDIDLIVLASHQIDPSLPEGGMWTMSYELGILSPCAVLLVK